MVQIGNQFKTWSEVKQNITICIVHLKLYHFYSCLNKLGSYVALECQYNAKKRYDNVHVLAAL